LLLRRKIFTAFLRLGLTSFGGPVAHLAYFHRDFVQRRKWLTEGEYAELVSLSQFLPGPGSSQVGAAIGLSQGGLAGAFAAWLGFTLPSAVLMLIFGLGLLRYQSALNSNWLHGIKIVTVAVVAQALWSMGLRFCRDQVCALIAITAAGLLLFVPLLGVQVAAMVGGAVVGLLFFQGKTESVVATSAKKAPEFGVPYGLCLCLFLVLLLIPVSVMSALGPNTELFARFYKTGALVFGGGHVVLPLLQTELVDNGLIQNDAFLAAYGSAQALPGPLFSIAACLGSMVVSSAPPWLSAVIALVGIFLPGLLLVVGVLPLWQRLRQVAAMNAAIKGINAAVVGILLAAFYQPVWTSAIHAPSDFAAAILMFMLLVFWRLPPWLVVILGASLGMVWS
jgi:chromate transporter